MYTFSFENLKAYQRSRTLVKETYSLINQFPAHENFGLSQQLRRAIISVPSNIAESCGRKSHKEKIRFLEIAFGSLTEAYCQLTIALDLGYISNEAVENIKASFTETAQLISGLARSYQRQLSTQSQPPKQ